MFSLATLLVASIGLAAGQEFWVNDIAHGSAPQNAGYNIFRNVKDFGCKGDGVADDTACINTAISSGGRCGNGCGSSTKQPAIVYFPAGKYRISSPIIMYYYTQMIGNARDRPTLIMDNSFGGLAMLDSDPYLDGGAQWYTNQNNFFRQIRNFIIDTTGKDANQEANCIHWQVAQATSLYNIKFNMPQGSKHVGVWMENGSGGFMSDLEFVGGNYGMWIGNQQFLTRNLKFTNCATAVYLIWNWQWTFKNLEIVGCQVGIDMAIDGGGTTESGVGSVLLIDSTITDTPIGVRNHGNPNPGDNSGTLLLDNVRLNNVAQAVADRNGGTVLNGGTTTIASWGRGSVYNDESGRGTFHQGDLAAPNKDASLLDGEGRFFVKSRPQYETQGAGDFANVRDYGAKGDGNTDDTAAIQAAIDANKNGKVIFFPHGFYVVTNTIRVPSGTRMTGEIWSVIMATGSAFDNWNNPIPMLRVGEPGEVGSVELSEFMFSTKGPCPGAILVQWNIKGNAPGAAGIWDSHFRVGGFAGSNLQGAQCPKGQAYNPNCVGAFLLLHVAKTGSGYFENVWAWTADHDLDGGVGQGQVSLYTGRGVLIQSENGPNWLYGTQSEHNIYYQYQLDNTKNVFLTMIQGETPYWQPAPPAPEPFPAIAAYNDPTYSECPSASSTCRLAWGLRSVGSSNVYLYGAGLYNFFNNYDQTCLNTESCQDDMVSLENNSRFYGFNINTKASKNIIVGSNRKSLAAQADNKNTFCQGVNAFLAQV